MVSILDKFNLSCSDIAFLQAEQSAYDAAGKFLDSVIDKYKDIFGGGSDVHLNYLGDVRIDNALAAIDNRHEEMIRNIVCYFRNKYNVAIDEEQIVRELLPSPPDCDAEDWERFYPEYDDYREKLSGISMTYAGVIRSIFSQWEGKHSRGSRYMTKNEMEGGG